jgi:hypothetical protein
MHHKFNTEKNILIYLKNKTKKSKLSLMLGFQSLISPVLRAKEIQISKPYICVYVWFKDDKHISACLTEYEVCDFLA